MIEVNLVPDVKQELIHAERARSFVITGTILVGFAAIALVGVLGFVVFGVQKVSDGYIEGVIDTEYAKLAAVEDIESTLTIQNQLATLPTLHKGKQVDSRIFDIIDTIAPPESSGIIISKLTVDSVEKTITIEAQASGGYPALEAFKKTILATEFHFKADDNTLERRMLTTAISDTERSYGEDVNSEKVLRFGLSFQYPEELFAPYLKEPRVVGPQSANVTDSYVGIPKGLSSEVNDSGEDR